MNKATLKLVQEKLIESFSEDMQKVTDKLSELPNIGDTIKHISEGKEFILTKEKESDIDFYDCWNYYKIIKRVNSKGISNERNKNMGT